MHRIGVDSGAQCMETGEWGIVSGDGSPGLKVWGRWYLSKRRLKRWTLLVAIAGEVVGCMGEKKKEKDKEAVRNKKVKKRQKIKKNGNEDKLK